MSIKSVDWTISRAKIPTIPSQSGALTYNGSAQTPSWANYSTAQLTLGGTTSGTNAGSYTATFTPKANYCWSDGSTGSKNVSWSIGRKSVAVPSQLGSLTFKYDSLHSTPQSPSWNNYNSSQLTIGGATSKYHAGTYTATFTPTSNYQWSDGSITTKSVNWTIGKAATYFEFNFPSNYPYFNLVSSSPVKYTPTKYNYIEFNIMNTDYKNYSYITIEGSVTVSASSYFTTSTTLEGEYVSGLGYASRYFNLSITPKDVAVSTSNFLTTVTMNFMSSNSDFADCSYTLKVYFNV